MLRCQNNKADIKIKKGRVLMPKGLTDSLRSTVKVMIAKKSLNRICNMYICTKVTISVEY